MSDSLCRSYTDRKNKYQSYPTEAAFCAGLAGGGNDTCHGDSGGPLYCKINGKQVLYGVTSTGDGVTCGRAGKPGIYARVSAAIPWIENIVRNNPEGIILKTEWLNINSVKFCWSYHQQQQQRLKQHC